MEGWCAELGCALEWVQKSTHLKHTTREEVLSGSMTLHQERGAGEGVHISPRVINNSHVGHIIQIEVVVIMSNVHHHNHDHLHLAVAGPVEGVAAACHALIHHQQDILTVQSSLMLKILTHLYHPIANMVVIREVMGYLIILLMTDKAAEKGGAELLDIVLVLTDSQNILHQLK